LTASKTLFHQSVLLAELIRFLDPKMGQDFIDATVGIGGHALAILSKTEPTGRILGIDWDDKALGHLQKKNHPCLILREGNFAEIEQIARESGFQKVEGVYFDLGLGSWQIEEPEYGLSFQKEMPLLMRVAPEGPSAAEIVNRYSLKQLTQILRDYGDLRSARLIAGRIVKARKRKKLQTTLDLKEAVAVKHPAVLARIFQAIRIATNNELENLKKGLAGAVNLLQKKGRLAVISYHSGEDRIVKRFFQEQMKKGVLKILTPKPIQPKKEEVKMNKRARSAKLRVAEKI